MAVGAVIQDGVAAGQYLVDRVVALGEVRPLVVPGGTQPQRSARALVGGSVGVVELDRPVLVHGVGGEAEAALELTGSPVSGLMVPFFARSGPLGRREWGLMGTACWSPSA